MLIVIAGCGRLGASIAKALSGEGWDIAVIDKPISRRYLGSGFDGLVIEGDPISRDALEEAGLARASIFVAATSDDNVNASAVQAVKAFFPVPRAIARFVDPERAAFYRGLGVDTICPTETGLNQILDFIRCDGFSPLEATVDPNVICVLPNKEWIGASLKEISPPPHRRLIGLLRGRKFLEVKDNTTVRPEDSILVSRGR
jgi:trk system potassium uptake protein